MPLLSVKELSVSFKTRKGILKAVDGVSFCLERGKTLGIVGESGSGKSVSAMSILSLLDRNGYVSGGEILFDGTDLARLSEKELNRIRGNRISMIFQEPMTSLNPVFSIKKQLSEPFILHCGMTKKEAARASLAMLASVQIPSPERVLRQYPHQLSGGMRQRVMMAMALATKPDLLIADEPTTALDVTVQAEILRLMKELQEKNGTAILFITHDLGVINEMADDVAVTYCGRVVEMTDTKTLFTDRPFSHPYTEGLMRSIPRLTGERARLFTIPGAVPPLDALPDGCKFAPRCRYATKRCYENDPSLFAIQEGWYIRCFYPEKKERRSDAHQKIVIGPRTEKVFSDW